jgi:4-amino-4-deoxy-L-arabinose transferase-like glycosyltransferase
MTETTELYLPERPVGLVLARAPRASAWVSETKSLLVLLALLVALRCWVAGRMDFESDETYYWLWSRHLALSYYDHPPMVAYLIRLGTWLLGDTAFGLRSMAILAILLASGLVYLLALALFDDRRLGLLGVLWFNAMPHTAFFSVIMFPDTPALLFWVLSVYALAQVWRSGRGEWWYLVGLSLGLTMLSKYTGLFLAFGAGAWLLLAPDMRRWLARREPYLGALIALAAFSPAILWNAQHSWVSFAKQFGRVLDSSSDGGLANAGVYLGVQAAFVSPLIFSFALAGMGVAAWRGIFERRANWLLLALTSAPVFLFFLLHALTGNVLAQWPSAAYATAILAGLAAFAGRRDVQPAGSAPLRWALGAAPILGLALSLGMYLQMTLAFAPIAAADDPLRRFSGWADLAHATGEIAAAEHAGYIATSEYGTNSILAFYLPRDMTVFQASEAVRYSYLPPVDQGLLGRSAGLYLTSAKDDKVQDIRPHYDSVVLLRMIDRARRGEPFEVFHLYRLSGYRGGLPY